MTMGDRIKPRAEEARGKVKQAAGKATDNDSLEAEGHADEASAKVKQAGDKVGDAAQGCPRLLSPRPLRRPPSAGAARTLRLAAPLPRNLTESTAATAPTVQCQPTPIRWGGHARGGPVVGLARCCRVGRRHSQRLRRCRQSHHQG